MSLFSFLRKNKQESAADDKTFYSRAEEDSKAVRRRGSAKGGRGGRGDNAADPVLPEKKRARRRLIGAVALVLAAVVGLPMILDSEPKPLDDDIAIQIPSKDKPAPARTPDPVAASAGLGEQEEVIEPPADSENSPANAAPVKGTSRPESQPRAAAAEKPAPVKPVEPPPKPERKPEPKPEPKHPEPQQAKVERKPEPRHAEPSAEDVRAKALLEGKPDPKAEQKNSGKFIIQVAALASREKVNELQSKLKDAGIKSYTQTIATGSGDRTRIRVGPFSSKEEAEKVRAKIVKLGLGGTLVPA